jgi:hypothetical protein
MALYHITPKHPHHHKTPKEQLLLHATILVVAILAAVAQLV